MFWYYRISDNSYPKEKLPGIGKRECLENFLSIFGEYEGLVVADNCSEDTVNWVKELGVKIKETGFGNAGAIRWCIQESIKNSEEYVYFVEDDYLHHEDADKILLDGFSLDSISYTTLFDHPDKYTEFYNFGESSKVYRNKHHWRLTQSTTMTFVARMRDLRKHWKIWDEYTSDQHPHDHCIFTKILEEYGGQLSCAIPGLSVHTDLSVSIGVGKVLMEGWALEMACESLFKQAMELVDDTILESIISCTEPGSWDRVKILHALVQTPLA